MNIRRAFEYYGSNTNYDGFKSIKTGIRANVDADLPDSVMAPDVAEGISQYYAKNVTPVDSFVRVVAFIISQSENIDVNEVLFRSTVQQL